jgi:hypothetical protein
MGHRSLAVLVALVGGLLLLALISLPGCRSTSPHTVSSTVSITGSTVSTTTSPAPPVKSIVIASPDQSTAVQPSPVLRLAWTPGPDASAKFAVSPDGQTIGIAEAPDRNSRTLHLYGRGGSPLLSRMLLSNIPHDSPFVALTDLVVVSPTDILLLLQHEDSFRVHRLTPNETGMSTEGVYLIHGVADQLAVAAPDGSDVWAHDGSIDRSYPLFLGGQAIWQDADQQRKARAGIPLGDTWVKMRREDAKITLTVAGSGGTQPLQILAPTGQRFVSARLLEPDASGLFYLVTELRPTHIGYSPKTIAIVSFSADGSKHSQLTLADTSSGIVPQFAVTRDGTVYGLWSEAGALEVVVYP